MRPAYQETLAGPEPKNDSIDEAADDSAKNENRYPK